MKENTKNHIKAFAYFSLFLLILGSIIVYFVLPFTIIQPQRIDHPHSPTNYKLDYADIRIINEPKDTLTGYWTYTENDKPKGIMLLLHGIGDCKEDLLPVARRLSKWGYDAILMDSRGHGKSENGYCTYGYYETKDFELVVDEIKRQRPDLRIGLWGQSLGGALGLQILENDKRVSFGIIESSFTHLRKIVYDYQKRIFKGLTLKYFTDFLLFRAAKIAEFTPNDVLPLESAKNIEQPTLIIHGTADDHISVEYGNKLFENLKTDKKELHLITGGRFDNLWEKGGKEYEQKVLQFIENKMIE